VIKEFLGTFKISYAVWLQKKKTVFMTIERELSILIKNMQPELNEGHYVFCMTDAAERIGLQNLVCFFKEKEGISVVIKKELADELGLSYSFVASWITLTVHSSLEAVGLTAAFSKALADNGISCNVLAAFYHDHIFVDSRHAEKAMLVLKALAASI
jgi:uncharacterized protein